MTPGTTLEQTLSASSLQVAQLLLGATLHGRNVSVRLTEVEAYLGESDPGSHAFRGPTPRTRVMFGPPGMLYAYFSYGMHVCANVVCSPDGEASAVLLRAGRVVDGVETARERRHAGRATTASRTDDGLARGPALLCRALGIRLDDNGAALTQGPLRLELPSAALPAALVATGPRVGVSGPGGSDAYPWRFWISGDPTVSAYKRGAVRGAAAR